jgi:hypothetical protein
MINAAPHNGLSLIAIAFSRGIDIHNFHISEISTTKKVFGVVDCFSAQRYNRFAKAFTSSES